MKKLTYAPKKLTLSRETVCMLEQQKLEWVAGGVTRSDCGVSCSPHSCLC